MAAIGRIILHIDMNSYFATVEQQCNPLLRGKPIVVSGRPHIHSVVAAASIEAKKLGVRSGMSTWEAKKICPSVIFIAGDPLKYIGVTQKLLTIFESYSDQIEVFSIDEVFLELPPNLATYDYALKIAHEIKARIREEIGDFLSCSIGISYNKLLAKLASEKQKPDGLVVISSENVDAMLLSSKLDDFCGIGRQVLKRLNDIGITNVAQLRSIGSPLLRATFGPARGAFLEGVAWGNDTTPLTVESTRGDQKSFSHNLTLPKETTDWNYIEAVLLRLCEKVGRRMRSEGFYTRLVFAHVRYTDLHGDGAHKTLSHSIESGEEIFAIAKELLKETHSREIRAIGVGVGSLLKKSSLTCPLLPEDRKKEKILTCMDHVNNHFGDNTVFRAAVMPAFEREKQVAGIRMRLRFN